jgi:Ca2+-binding RTX toxin-like protein
LSIIRGSNRNDSTRGTGDADEIYGLGGDDTLEGSDGTDLLRGGNGNDVLFGGAGVNTLEGDSGRDTLTGTDGDLVDGGAGDDTLILGAGFRARTLDLVTFGGSGDDRFLSVAAGVSGQTDFQFGLKLYGDAGADSFTFATIQASTIEGGSGNDHITIDSMLSGSLRGSSGDDQFDIHSMLGQVAGGSGDDHITIGFAKVISTATGEDGDDTISAGVGTCNIDGGAGNDELSNGFDLNAPASRVDGGNGNDRLSSQGRDYLFGGDGRDTLESAAFANSLAGGDRADRFIYGDMVFLNSIRADSITDFNYAAGDVLELTILLQRVGASSNPLRDGWVGLEAQDGNTRVQFDQNGGGDNFVTLATLQGTVLPADGGGSLIL